ncbi:phosphoribosylamine--glycine ligase [Chitinivibrio alkaliphilus]|uniref:Phosphoribosylamine--glycine ligase n=1 Tax=Chitinivibrio alkaliphilus ACht1 TaxID=1313304 RepID=U7DCQ2_9BACT|nr:phosphoribosylamine--glycine ligase [Chitinivibrio alkaliphilus]ERP39338.1 phosphoribosylamine/glycine ligase [Chitinivibrio alkaliphilus ACht1]
MNTASVLVVGNGGREHALCTALLKSDTAPDVYIYPRNEGAVREGALAVPKEVRNWEELAEWSQKKGIGLAIIGPEQPLVEGIKDLFVGKNIPVFGPSKAAARLEGSKLFSKELMEKYHIPTAPWKAFSDKQSALSYVQKKGAPLVVKVSGLAAGKGAMVCDTMEEIEQALTVVFDTNAFGSAGETVVIEDMMYGEEASVFVITDGDSYKILPVSQDHKRIFDGDTGPNTGGMGAYAPAELISSDMLADIEKKIIAPTLSAMTAEGCPYTGLLYVGLMLTEDGPQVVEYNCRFGDPETEAVLPLVDCDWYTLFHTAATGGVEEVSFSIRAEYCATVVVASKGYPESSDPGQVIDGIERANAQDNVQVYFAGITTDAEGRFITNGGRVLTVTGTGKTLQEAVDRAYAGVSEIKFSGMQYRTDIGHRAL